MIVIIEYTDGSYSQHEFNYVSVGEVFIKIRSTMSNVVDIYIN